jgi:hypothetical protein
MDPAIFPQSTYIHSLFGSDKAIQKMGNAARPIWTAYCNTWPFVGVKDAGDSSG